jgi:hypothetical protein
MGWGCTASEVLEGSWHRGDGFRMTQLPLEGARLSNFTEQLYNVTFPQSAPSSYHLTAIERRKSPDAGTAPHLVAIPANLLRAARASAAADSSLPLRAVFLTVAVLRRLPQHRSSAAPPDVRCLVAPPVVRCPAAPPSAPLLGGGGCVGQVNRRSAPTVEEFSRVGLYPGTRILYFLVCQLFWVTELVDVCLREQICAIVSGVQGHGRIKQGGS